MNYSDFGINLVGTLNMSSNTIIISSEKNWLEGEAVRQLETTAALPGMVRAIGLPDLHAGKGHPIGAVFATKDVIYPYLIGNDIGCGMAFFKTRLKGRKVKVDKLVKKLHGLEFEVPENEASAKLKEHNLDQNLCPMALGTLGGGNHFAEFQKVSSVENHHLLEKVGLEKDQICLLVHSGSRGLGEVILRRYVYQFRASGIDANSIEAKDYLEQHNDALVWARLNRLCIGERLLSMASAEYSLLSDMPHNMLSFERVGDDWVWLHRKGAVPVMNNSNSSFESSSIFVLPGSRGSLTYLVKFIGNDETYCLNSLAHGAGRKWNRGECKGRLKDRFTKEKMSQTKYGSHVICEDKELLYEEAPQAYKNIDHVVESLISAELIEVVATMKPIVTYKKRKIR